MLNLHRQPASVESSQSPRDPQDWVVRVPANFLDARRTGLSDRGRALVPVLGYFARDKAYCWASLATLGQWTGKDERNVRKILGELEGSWTRRVYDAPGRLVGIILLRRAESDMPVADTPERVAAAERDLRQAREGKGGSGRSRPSEGDETVRTWGTRSSGPRGTRSSAEF